MTNTNLELLHKIVDGLSREQLIDFLQSHKVENETAPNTQKLMTHLKVLLANLEMEQKKSGRF
jgi:hypothetical protein